MPPLRNRIQFVAAGWLGAGLLRALYATWRVRVDDPWDVEPAVRTGSGQALLAFWHRQILSLLAHFRGSHICTPVSESSDGEYVAQAMHRFRVASVRGSSSRGGVRLLKGLLAHADRGWSPAITPDGPRGPKFSVQPGVALLARRSGLPVHPMGVSVRDAWELSSWDEFVVPKPWTEVAIAIGPPLMAEDYGGTSEFCEALREALFAATDRAGELLADRKAPTPG